MRILLISAVFSPEPVVSAKLSRDLAEALCVENDVTVLCPQPSRPKGFIMNEYKDEDCFQVIRLNSFTCASSRICGRFRESYSFGKHCKKYIYKNWKCIDVIYMSAWPLFSQYIIIAAARKYNIRVVTHVQDIYPESLIAKFNLFKNVLKLLLTPVDNYVLKHSSKIIAISNNMKDLIVNTRSISSEKVCVVYNWQDEQDFEKYHVNKIPNNQPKCLFTFMYLGNIGPVAGIEVLIDAFVNSKLQNSRLIIAGSGSRRDSLIQYAKLKGTDSIEFLHVPEGKVPEIQSLADVLLLPIKKEASSSSFPSKLPAYMFSQKPIIGCAPEGSDIELVINSSNCGWIVPPEDIERLSWAMSEAVKCSRENLIIFGLNGFNYAINNLSKNYNRKKIVEIIQSIETV